MPEMKPRYEQSGVAIYCGDALSVLLELPDESVNCCVTSPPYWGLRDYGTASWEGGNVECEHKSGGQVNQTKDRGTGRGEVYSSGVRPGSDSSECSRCGAVRVDAQLGLEKTPEEYVSKMVAVFREVRRVLRDDGTLWLNIGDSYNAHPGQRTVHDKAGTKQLTNRGSNEVTSRSVPNLKPKDLVGVPWMVAFALRADGWYLRSDIIWAKQNPMPESVTDRPTRSHEYIFLLSKSERYFYDCEAIKETSVSGDTRRPYGPGIVDKRGNGHDRGGGQPRKQDGHGRRHAGFNARWDETERRARPSVPRGGFNGKTEAMADTGRNAFRAVTEMRNRRDVWTVSPQPYQEAHFATFPEALIRPCVLAGCPEGGTLLDPFLGAATTALVAKENGRRCIGIELSEEYCKLSAKRLSQEVFQFEGEGRNP